MSLVKKGTFMHNEEWAVRLCKCMFEPTNQVKAVPIRPVFGRISFDETETERFCESSFGHIDRLCDCPRGAMNSQFAWLMISFKDWA